MLRKIDYLVVHCSDTEAGADYTVADIDRWHIERDWKGVGYHYVIRLSGAIENGRREDRIGAHVEGYNHNSIGVCLVGGKRLGAPANTYTSDQFTSLRTILTALLGRYPGAQVLGHHDFPSTKKACPCFDVRSWWSNVGSALV